MKGEWTNIKILGKTVEVYDLPTKPRFGILHLHPYGLETLRDNRAFTDLFDELNLVCACPHGQHSWWADRICPEFDPEFSAEHFLLQGVLPMFEERWDLRPRSIGIQGISMGGQGALKLAFKYPKLFPAAAGIASAIDYHEVYGQGTCLDEMYDSKEQCRQDTALMHIHPSNHPPHLFLCIDPLDAAWLRGNDRLHEKMNALGVAHEHDFTTSLGGHCWEYFNGMAERTVRFLFDGLQTESMRLL